MKNTVGINACGLLRFLPLFLFLAVAPRAFPQDDFPRRGDSAMAEYYAQWAKNAVDEGRWSEAFFGLERASDFADVSSDISYLLALVRFHENKPRLSVLEALEKALGAEQWILYDSEAARLLKAETLIALRSYHEAMIELSQVSKSPLEAELALKALVNYRGEDFHRLMLESLDLYPLESGPVKVFFRFLNEEISSGRNPGNDDLEILELIFRRLPLLVQRDPDLAWIAAPFMRDPSEAALMVSAYREENKPVPASIPSALLLGLIDEEAGLQELFASSLLDIALLSDVWDLLRSDESRALFRKNLSAFTGVITEDADGDGIPETIAEYSTGKLLSYTYDPGQSNVPEVVVYCDAAVPRRAFVFLPPESAFPAAADENGAYRKRAEILWDQYPAVLEVGLDGARYISRPLDLFYSPTIFSELWGTGLFFPQRNPLNPPFTRRVLISHSLRVERPSLEFSGAMEVVELNQGIPIRAREYAGELMVSETEFLRGRPQLQRVDLNHDGRMDTIRHFRRSYRPAELEELWDYERDYDYTVSIEP